MVVGGSVLILSQFIIMRSRRQTSRSNKVNFRTFYTTLALFLSLLADICLSFSNLRSQKLLTYSKGGIDGKFKEFKGVFGKLCRYMDIFGFHNPRTGEIGNAYLMLCCMFSVQH